jgi:branched-chain amino acid transport system ATP-binding protein
MLDEPASGLDDERVAQLRDIVVDVAHSGIAVLLVEHDRVLVEQVADAVHVLEYGRLHRQGSSVPR